MFERVGFAHFDVCEFVTSVGFVLLFQGWLWLLGFCGLRLLPVGFWCVLFVGCAGLRLLLLGLLGVLIWWLLGVLVLWARYRFCCFFGGLLGVVLPCGIWCLCWCCMLPRCGFGD